MPYTSPICWWGKCWTSKPLEALLEIGGFIVGSSLILALLLRGAEGDDCNKISWMPLHALPMHFSVLKDKHKISTGQKETQSSVNDAWQNIRTFPDYLYLNVIKGQNDSQNLCYAAGMSLSQ